MIYLFLLFFLYIFMCYRGLELLIIYFFYYIFFIIVYCFDLDCEILSLNDEEEEDEEIEEEDVFGGW